VTAGDLAAGDRAHHAVDVADRQLRDHLLAALDGRRAQPEQRRHVERALDPVVLLVLAVAAPVRVHFRRVEKVGEVEPLRLPVVDRGARLEAVDAAHHLLESAEAELRHDLAQFLGHEAHEVHDVLGLALELLAQARVLVATPAGQVFRWQTRIMMQPVATSGAVAKPNSSAPSSAAMATSRPVLSWPSVSTAMRS